jgi:hypothetical protein
VARRKLDRAMDRLFDSVRKNARVNLNMVTYTMDDMFYNPETRKIDLMRPLKKLWFFIPTHIEKKNWQNIQYRVQANGELSKPNPWMRMIIRREERCCYKVNWWTMIEVV